MAENTKIEWADHTFNPWTGCTAVSPACDHCYAEGWAKRSGHVQWGPHGERRRTSGANWNLPRKWNREALGQHRRARVFCASLADVFDNHGSIADQWRDDLWRLIWDTPHLDWLLLTKRPQNIAKMLPKDGLVHPSWGKGWPNVWLGTTVENQVEADRRIPNLLSVPAKVRFLSCEPLLGPVDLTKVGFWKPCYIGEYGGAGHEWLTALNIPTLNNQTRSQIHWVICGGESGPGARPMHLAWARSLRDQCQAAGVAFHFKQWGEFRPPETEEDHALVRAGKAYGGSLMLNGQFGNPYGRAMVKVGKKAAGRLLDGQEWNEVPM